MVVFRRSVCIRGKVIVFNKVILLGKNWLYSGKWLYSCKSGCNLAKWFLGQSGYLGKVVEFD